MAARARSTGEGGRDARCNASAVSWNNQMPATWTTGARTGSQAIKGDGKLAADLKTSGKSSDSQAAVEAKVSGDGTGKANAWLAVPDLSDSNAPAWTRIFVCGILMAALSAW